jgi:hypothetical protein
MNRRTLKTKSYIDEYKTNYVLSYLISLGIKNEQQMKQIASLILASNIDSNVRDSAEELASMEIEKIKEFILNSH